MAGKSTRLTDLSADDGCEMPIQAANVGARKAKQATRDPFLVYKLGKQFCIVAIWLVIGFYVEIVGPTIPDLKQTLGFSYEQISRGLACKAIGFFIGSLLGGLLHERFFRHTDLILAVGLVLGSIGTFFIPWFDILACFAAMFMLTGISEGFLNTGGNTMVLHLWAEKAPGPMHSIHAGFGIGSFIVPQIVRPFLLPVGADDMAFANGSIPDPMVNYTTVTYNSTLGDSARVDSTLLRYPYAIVSACVMLVAFIWFGLYFAGPPKGFPVRNPSKSMKKLVSPGSCAQGRTCYAFILLICLFIYFMQACGGERAFGKFLFTYAVEADVSFSKDDAALLNSVFWGSHALGRCLGIFIAHFIRPQIIISSYLVIIIATTICIKIFTYNSAIALWVLTSMTGLFSTIFFPSGMAWANVYLEMNSMATMVLLMGAAAGAMVYQYMPGYLFDMYGFKTFGYIMIVYSLGMAAVFIIMQIVGSMYGPANVYKDADLDVGSEDKGEDEDGEAEETVHLNKTAVV